MPSNGNGRMTSAHNEDNSLPRSASHATAVTSITSEDTAPLVEVVAAPSSTNGETPPRASLQGLPAELRVLIYGYLFGGNAKLCERCCYILGRHLPRLFICDCTQGRFLNILRTSKRIFNEAMPVLYQNIEITFVLPTRCYTMQNKITERVQEFIHGIPHYGRQYVNDILIAGSIYDTAIIAMHWRTDVSAAVKSPMTMVADAFCNIKHVRMFIVDLSCGFSPAAHDFAQLTETANLPEVKTIAVKFIAGPPAEKDMSNSDKEMFALLTKELHAEMEAKAKAVGNNTSVDVLWKAWEMLGKADV